MQRPLSTRLLIYTVWVFAVLVVIAAIVDLIGWRY